MKQLIIDIHAHFVPKCLIERFDGEATKFPGIKLLRTDAGVRMQFPGTEPTRPIAPKLSDLADRRAWMDQNGIDHQLLGGWLDIFGYELAAAEGLAWSSFVNECMWNELRDEPQFTPLATVPLQDGLAAAKVLDDAMAKGFGGVMIGTLPKGSSGNLDDPSLDPFWTAAAKLGAAVFLHPMFVCGEPRLADYDLVNAIGRLADTSIAVSRLLFSGHLLKFSGLKLVLSHGGAALPFALGRLARNHRISEAGTPTRARDLRPCISIRAYSTRMRSNIWRRRPEPTASCSAPTCRSPSAIRSPRRSSRPQHCPMATGRASLAAPPSASSGFARIAVRRGNCIRNFQSAF
jgi:aminocarboxymuconate-semialdehyde decarboxylase